MSAAEAAAGERTAPPLLPRQRRIGLYVVWKGYQRRAEALAPLLDSELVFMPHTFRSRWLRPLDYVLKAARTVALLARSRPGFVVFQSPPHVGPLLAWLLRVPYVVDAHNVTFQGRWLRAPGAEAVLRRARAVIVHNDEIAELAERAVPGLPLVVMRDPVPELPGAGEPERRDPRQVLLVCSFAADEPVDVILDAVAAAPEFRFVVTADPARLTREQRARLTASPNVELTGFLSAADYQRVLATSRAAVVLTTRPATQPSGACEALSSDTPLVVSRTALTERLFGSWARLVANDASEIVAALRDPSLAQRSLAAERAAWNADVHASIKEVLAAVGEPAPSGGRHGTDGAPGAGPEGN